MTTTTGHKDVHVKIPMWFYDQLVPLVDGIEVTDFTQLIRVSLKRYLASVVTPSPSAPPPPRETSSFTPPLISPKGDIYSPPMVSPSEPKPKAVVRRRRIAYSQEFQEFWLVFPHSRGSKEKTFEEFRAVVSAGLLSESELLCHAGVYADRCKRDKTEPQYVKQPVNWLKDRRWEDDDKSGRFSVLPELKDNPHTEEPVWLD